MPLEKQVLSVPLSAGLGQKEDVRGLAPLQAAKMQNCVRQKNGAIRKRFGTLALATTVSNENGVTMPDLLAGGSLNQSMWATDDHALYTWSDAQSAWAWQSPFPDAIALDRIVLAQLPTNIVDSDWAYCSGYVFVVYSAPDATNSAAITLYLMAVDASALGNGGGAGGLQQGITAAIALPATSLAANVIAPKVVACGTTIVVSYLDGSGNLAATSYNASTLAVVHGGTTLIAAASLSTRAKAGGYDLAIVNGDATRFVVATSSSGLVMNFYSFTVSTLALAATHATPVATLSNVAAYITNQGYWWLAGPVSGGSVLRAAYFNEGNSTTSTTTTDILTSGGANVGPVSLAPVAGAHAAVSIGIAFSSSFAPGTTAMQTSGTWYAQIQNLSTTVLTATAVAVIPNVQLVSTVIYNAFHTNAYAILRTPSTLQGSSYLVELAGWSFPGWSGAAGRAVATLAPRLQKNLPQQDVVGGSWTLPHLLTLPTIASAASGHSATGVVATLVPYSTSAFHGAVALQPLELFPAAGRASAQLGSTVAMSAGVPTVFDGQLAVELGFTCYPEPSASPVGSGGFLSAGVYQYIVTYEWFDNAGNIHRSATSPTQTVTAVNNGSVTLTIPGPGLFSRQSMQSVNGGPTTRAASLPVAVVYRTTAGGTVFYRATADPAPQANVLMPTASTLTITDTVADGVLAAGSTAQLLYTTGGLLDNFNPPSARCLVQHTQRWFLAGCDNPYQVWASKALTDGECPGFSEQLAFLSTGSVRALASMDDKLILFTQRGPRYGIEYVTGQGPTDTGTQSDWTPPLPVPSDVGAVDQRGTCVGPFGVLFRSPVGGPNGTGGIYLLSRDLQVSYVGAAVEDLLAACPVVTSMVVHPNAGRVYITTVSSDSAPATTGGATRLVWDYVNGGAWSSDVVYDTDAGAFSLACRTAWIASAGGTTGPTGSQVQGPTYHCGSTSGRVYRETAGGTAAGAYMDSGTHYVTMSYTSAPLKPDADGFARFWRVQLQADSLEAHDFTMQLLYDYAPASYYQESHTWTAVQIATFDRAPQVDVELLCGNQKAKAVQVVLSDATPTGGGATTGQGPSWSTLSLELGVKPGRYVNIPSAQRS